jgi:uncharacterized protein YfaS (alpha-2-macroglobulin family)
VYSILSFIFWEVIGFFRYHFYRSEINGGNGYFSKELTMFKGFRRTLEKMAKSPFQFLISILILGALVTIFATFASGLMDTEVRVTSFGPTGQVDLKSNFTIKFSKDMVSRDSLDLPVLEPPIKFTPPIRGLARWIGTNELRFFPDAELLPATEYVATVESDKTWICGYKINNKDVYKFHSPWLRLMRREAQFEADPNYPLVRIAGDLEFNYKVSLEELQKKMTVAGTRGPAKASLKITIWDAERPRYASSAEEGPSSSQQYGYANHFQFMTESFPQLKELQWYTFTIEKGLGCKDCGMTLPEEAKLVTIIEPKRPLNVVSANINDEYEARGIRINFSLRVTADEARSFITLEPKCDYTIEESYGGIILHGNFKPGETYGLDIARGLHSQDGTELEREFSTRIKIPDLQPSINFTSSGAFLPRQGNGLLEFKTINISDVTVEVEQVFANNLVYFLQTGYGNSEYYYRQAQLGRSLFIKEKQLATVINEPLLTTIDLAGIIGDTAQGIFKVTVRNKENRWQADSRYAMITDIGLSARLSNDYLMVWANSLSKGEPLSGVAVTLISNNNQMLVEGKTNSQGVAIFEKIKDKLAGFVPFVVTAKKNDDLSYLRLDQTLLPITDFDVSGRPYLSSGYEAFIYSDRGIYRPGDTAHFVAVVRGVEATMPPEFPYLLTINDSRGKKFTSFKMTTGGTSIGALDFPVPDFAGTGKYSIAAVIGEDLVIGRYDFQVEEFMPDRIKVTLSTPQTSYRSGETVTADVNAKFLFGPPAAGHRVSGHLTIEPFTFAPRGWSQYSFTNTEISFTRAEIDLKDTLLNDTGGYTYRHDLPSGMIAPSSLKGLLSATVSEAGGRGVSAYSEFIIHPYDKYVGLRTELDGYAKPGQMVEASIIALDTEGKPIVLPDCDVRLYRIVYNTVLKMDRAGFYRYMSERKPILTDSTMIAVGVEGGKVSFTPNDYGSYQIIARDKNGGHSSSINFYVSGWGYAPWVMTNPDKIELAFDKKNYVPGEKGILQIRAPFGGKLLVTVEKEKVTDFITKEMSGNTAEIEIPIKNEYFPNAYVTASIIRPADSLEPNMPARAFGIAPLLLSLENKRLKINITAPEVARPKSHVKCDVQVDHPRISTITVAAVDAGILQLTDFKTPDPIDFFYGKKQPGLRLYDLYSFIYPKVALSSSHIGAGGKMFEASRLRHLNPVTAKRIKSVALWSGVVKTDETGRATVEFDLPEFNGKLILMAVGIQKDLFGSSSRELIIRDKIVIQENFPRFVSPNDIFDGLVTIFNNTGARADITVTATAEGPVELLSPASTTINLDNNQEGLAAFKIKAGLSPGRTSFKITAKCGDEQTSVGIELPNRPALPLITKYGSGVANRNMPSEFIFPDDWLPGTEQYLFRTSSMPAVSFARNIQYLLTYPYGCVEQTTSRLFPLLYFNDLVKVVEPSLFGSRGHEYFIQEGILRLTSMMLPDRSFAFWPGANYSNNWATIYASHFLIEADRAGYSVDKKVIEQILDHLNGLAQGKEARDLNDAQRIYAGFVLAKAGKISQKIITYLKNLDPTILQPYSRYQLAGALALAGDLSLAAKYIPVDVQENIFEPETGGDFSSPIRNDAILLDVLLETMPDYPTVPVLVKNLMEQARIEHWYTTQDNAFALMALGKYFRNHSGRGYAGTITIDDGKTYPIDSTGFKLSRKDLGNRKVKIDITSGDGDCFYYWQSSGISSGNAAPEFDRGITVRREYLDEDAKPVDLANIKVGDRLVCVITATATDKPLYNVVINDLLPAGLEIENPRLKTSARLSWIPSQGATIDYQDIRDDRLLIFANLYPRNSSKFYYSLRAICAGDFKIPPVAAECMYNPLVASSASSGVMTIKR